MEKAEVKNIALAAMFLAIGLILPFFTGQIPQIGNMLLPMHIPVLLCGLICGWKYGAIVGLVLPPLRFALFGMPPLLPTGIAMAFELATYGGVIGFWYNRSKWQCIIALYRAMIIAMVTGRIVWGVAQSILLGFGGNMFTMKMFMAGAFINAVPGIIVQLILIPTIMIALNRTGVVKFKKNNKESAIKPVN